MTTPTRTTTTIPEAQLGPAEKLLDLVLSSSAHLWHNRPGVAVHGKWQPAPRARGKAAAPTALPPGLFVPAAVELYRRLLEIHQLNAELMAHFASYALTETDWRDLKVACAALMLVQPLAGQPVKGDDGKVAFHEDDHRVIGEAMLLRYVRKSPRMMTPKGILRVAELLETPEIAALNRRAGFADAGGAKAPLGRWKQAASKWLAIREKNLQMLEGLVSAGYKQTIMKIARKVGYKPDSQAFFEVLGWKQKQAAGGHRTVGLSGSMKLAKRERFDGLSEAEICEWIAEDKLGYKDVVGRLPKEIGLTPAIMVATLPSLSDKDLRLMTPTLEELGLLSVPEIRARWEKAIATSTDQRALNIAKNVRSKVIREKLEEAADNAAKNAVKEAAGGSAEAEALLHVMFLIDKSGSMQGAIEQSKEALSRMLAGFPPERLHIATFDTMGTVLVPKAPSRQAVQHMLAKIGAGGGTIHGSAVRALAQKGVSIPRDAKLIVIVVGDEAGEDGAKLAECFTACGYHVSALALIVSVANASARGNTVRQCAAVLQAPYSEVAVAQFDDPYQVTRVLKTLLEAPPPPRGAGAAVRTSWVDKVMQTPILTI